MTKDMTVRKMAATTFSLVVLLVVWNVFAPIVWNGLPGTITDQLEWRLMGVTGPNKEIIAGSFSAVVVSAILDSMLRHRVSVSVLVSFLPIITPAAMIGILALALPPTVNEYLFWGLVYLAAIVAASWMSRKIATICQPKQSFGRFLKMIPQLGGHSSSDTSDRVLTFATALVLLAFDVVMVVFFIVFVVSHRGLIF